MMMTVSTVQGLVLQIFMFLDQVNLLTRKIDGSPLSKGVNSQHEFLRCTKFPFRFSNVEVQTAQIITI